MGKQNVNNIKQKIWKMKVMNTQHRICFVLTCSFYHSETSSLVKTFAISVMSCFENVVPRYVPNNVCFCILVPVLVVHNSVQPSLMNCSLHKCRILNIRNICVWCVLKWNVSLQAF